MEGSDERPLGKSGVKRVAQRGRRQYLVAVCGGKENMRRGTVGGKGRGGDRTDGRRRLQRGRALE